MDTFDYKFRRVDDAIADIAHYIEWNDNVYEYLWETCPYWDEDMPTEFFVLEYMKKYYLNQFYND